MKMKNTLITTLLISSAAIYSCKSNKYAGGNYGSANNTAEANNKGIASADTACPAPMVNDTLSSGTGMSNEQLLNIGGYSANRNPSTNFQGASGSGTGSSYASNYYARERYRQKTSKTVCTPAGAASDPALNKKTVNSEGHSEIQTDTISDVQIIQENSIQTSSAENANVPDKNEGASEWITDNSAEQNSQTNQENTTGDKKSDEVPW
jgi:hypothetical protein